MEEAQEKIEIYREVKEIRKTLLREELQKLFEEINEFELYDSEEREEAKQSLHEDEIRIQEQAFKKCLSWVLDTIERKIQEISKQ